MTRRTPSPILLDTSALIAICKTDYDARLFETLEMETTNVCNEEIRRQKGTTPNPHHRRACERYLELVREKRNPDVRYVGEYEPYVENQGERTIEAVFRAHPGAVTIILLFDFDAIERFDELKHGLEDGAVIAVRNHYLASVPREGMAGTRCPECDGFARSADGTTYECRECGTTFDGADLFLP